MTGHRIIARPLTAAAFAPFGEVLEAAGPPSRLINQGLCGRYHDLARLDFGTGRAGISLFNAVPQRLPYRLEMMERHPEGSQAFLPMTQASFLVIVAEDVKGIPGPPQTFLTAAGQGVNYRRNTWHGVLVPLDAGGLFAVVDRIGDGANLEEHHFPQPWTILPGQD